LLVTMTSGEQFLVKAVPEDLISSTESLSHA
jgi:hypothetical protein